MKKILTATVSALALATLGAPASAQHQHHPGMQMPAPAKKKPAVKKKAPAKKTAATKKPPVKKPAAKRPSANKPIPAQPKVKPRASHAGEGYAPPTATAVDQPDPQLHQHGATPPPPVSGAPASSPVDHSQMDHSRIDHSQIAEAAPAVGEHAGHGVMTGALGPYPMAREASGTAWQPDSSAHPGITANSGAWTLMAHGLLNLVYDHQSGPRGDDKLFASGMLMGMARRPIGSGTLQFKAMVSPEPLMGKRGYPLLLASGETANGSDLLVDRQHPHEFVMELSASVSQNFGSDGSLFLYAGLPGEPAFGPPAFMHREAILDSPEAPISHHWLDSTHISFGVVTAGAVFGAAKLEVSRFNGREPDQHRWNIETGPLDSTAVRLSLNPTRTVALQASWGHFEDPEQLEPGVDQRRWSASALYADEVAPGWKLATTLAWGRKSVAHHHDDAFVAEASIKNRSLTLFGRGEITENRELRGHHEEEEEEGEGHAGEAFRVGKISLGVIRDLRLSPGLVLGAGGLVSLSFVPGELAPDYGSRTPEGAMAFVRLKLE